MALNLKKKKKGQTSQVYKTRCCTSKNLDTLPRGCQNRNQLSKVAGYKMNNKNIYILCSDKFVYDEFIERKIMKQTPFIVATKNSSMQE